LLTSAPFAPMVGVMRAVRIIFGAIVLAALIPTAGSAAPRRAHVSLTPLESGVLVDINAFRRAHHLQALRLSVSLSDAAREHTVQMAQDGYFAHTSADGSAFWRRIQSFYPSSTWGYWSVGENLLWSSPDVTPERALELWLASPEHRANLMTARWREIGVAAVHTTAAPGVYDGLDVTIVTTDFGVRH
jgi:uncharacterized protein YkwD